MIFVLYAKHSFVLLTNLTSYPNFCNECSDYFRKMLFYISSIEVSQFSTYDVVRH
jgi:hypothetical protein